MQNMFDSLLLFGFITFFGFVLWSLFSKSGKGKMLGGTIVDSSNESIVQKSGITKTTIKTHVIEEKNKKRHVGIEISQNAKLAASMTPIKLSKEEAVKLVSMLNESILKT